MCLFPAWAINLFSAFNNQLDKLCLLCFSLKNSHHKIDAFLGGGRPGPNLLPQEL